MTKGQETAQRLIAVLVIMAMLAVMGIPLTVIVFFATVVFFVWRAVQRSEQQDVKNIFDFYVSANEILRDDEKRWYGFEVNRVIAEGERVLHMMADPPPLVYFTLGALYHRAGDHEAAAEHLSYIVENDLSDERHRLAPSAELRRYVHILRKLEREPAVAPQTMAAIRSLDRARHNRAAYMLAESRERLNLVTSLNPAADASSNASRQSPAGGATATETTRRQSTLAPPPPIAEVLRDLYEEEKKTA